jgi:peptidyl-prolyl cis-trans isomerase-like protein 2
MERVPTDADDRPSPSGAIVIESVEVFVDPYEDAAREEAEAAEKKREDEARDERERLEALNPGRWWSNPAGEAARAADDAPTAKAGGGVGTYISAAPKRRLPDPPTGAAVAKKAKSSGGGYGNFDAW